MIYLIINATAPSTYELSIAIYDHSVNIYFKVVPMPFRSSHPA